MAGISPAVRKPVCVRVLTNLLSMPRRRHRDGECGRRHAHGGEEHNSLASSLHPRLQALGRLPPNLASVCHCHTKGGSCCAPDPYKKSPIPSRQLPMSRRSGAWALDPVRSRTVSGMDDTLAPSTLVTNTAWARQPTRCPGPTRGSRIGCDRRSHFPIPPSFPCLAERNQIKQKKTKHFILDRGGGGKGRGWPGGFAKLP